MHLKRICTHTQLCVFPSVYYKTTCLNVIIKFKINLTSTNITYINRKFLKVIEYLPKLLKFYTILFSGSTESGFLTEYNFYTKSNLINSWIQKYIYL